MIPVLSRSKNAPRKVPSGKLVPVEQERIPNRSDIPAVSGCYQYAINQADHEFSLAHTHKQFCSRYAERCSLSTS